MAIPSTGSSTTLASNEPDVAAVREVIEELSDDGKEIIIVAHSYGAIVACEAVKGLEHQGRLKLGMSGGVIRMLFIAAWLLQEGESAPNVIGRNKMEAPWVKFDSGRIIADDPVYAFYNDVSADVAAYWSPQITHSDVAAFATPLKYAAWRLIPTTYVICEMDKSVLPHVQESMVVSTEGAVKAIRLPSGHLPMLSVPEALSDILVQEVGKDG
ncbi:MAG: hypothetical protein HETSPECPRED_001798 [Heterodermia speciosa]|uniref:AB hydrolase-1 domain-containing protein n=1 Tax=Heterodermia speciosa TaxID=116794 RepID=A0A8H3PFX2_9LECA|nr:MAG: hypothetical protein HETSPECPRED_001798 [Heterodermia speciosa]